MVWYQRFLQHSCTVRPLSSMRQIDRQTDKPPLLWWYIDPISLHVCHVQIQCDEQDTASAPYVGSSMLEKQVNHYMLEWAIITLMLSIGESSRNLWPHTSTKQVILWLLYREATQWWPFVENIVGSSDYTQLHFMGWTWEQITCSTFPFFTKCTSLTLYNT